MLSFSSLDATGLPLAAGCFPGAPGPPQARHLATSCLQSLYLPTAPWETDCIAIFFSFSPDISQKSYLLEQEAHSPRRQTRNSFHGTSGSLIFPSVKQQGPEPGFLRCHFPYEFHWPYRSLFWLLFFFFAFFLLLSLHWQRSKWY